MRHGKWNRLLAWVALCGPWLAHGQARPLSAPPGPSPSAAPSLLETGAPVDQAVGGLQYVDAVCGDGSGNIFFADVPSGRVLRWSTAGRLSIMRDGTASPMGSCVAPNGELVITEARGRRLTVINAEGDARTLVESYQGKKLNSPCGVWVDPRGGVYFSDPRMDHGEPFEQEREGLYYLPPDGAEPRPVAVDMRRPDALAASPDGKILYVSDIGDNKTWAFDIGPEGAVSGKRPLAPSAARGLVVDERGNVYLISGAVRVFSPTGTFIEEFRGPGPACSGAFGGEDGRTLFLSCNIQKPVPGAPPGKVVPHGGLYAVRMKVRGPMPMAPPAER